jgi:hypothetical protein
MRRTVLLLLAPSRNALGAATLIAAVALGGEAVDKPGSALDIAAGAQRNVAS